MDALVHQFAERGVNSALPLDPVQAYESGAFDDEREVAFAARIMAGVADMLVALVLELQPGGRQGDGQALDHLAGDRAGGGCLSGSWGHRSYIERFRERGRMQILVTKGERADWIEARRGDGSVERENVPHKGPIAHDLVHFAVETGLGMDRGFWGMIAGGHSPQQIVEIAKAAGHASAKRAATPDPKFVQAIQVERIVESFEAESWSGGNDNNSLRAMAEAGCDQSLVACPDLANEDLDRVRSRLGELAGQWSALAVGETLTLDWPLEGRAAE